MKTRLQLFLKEKFGVLVSTEPPSNPTLPSIGDYCEYESGDHPYSGNTSHSKLILHNFLRPDNQDKLEFCISTSLHHLSGQMDIWNVEIMGMELSEVKEMKRIIDPYQYTDFSCSNFLKPTLILNGATIDFIF